MVISLHLVGIIFELVFNHKILAMNYFERLELWGDYHHPLNIFCVGKISWENGTKWNFEIGANIISPYLRPSEISIIGIIKKAEKISNMIVYPDERKLAGKQTGSTSYLENLFKLWAHIKIAIKKWKAFST